MIGICRHLGEPAFAEKPVSPDPHPIHRQSCEFRDDTNAHWIRSYMFITAELDEVDDVFCLGQVG
jgi:hypothetical protein